MRTNLIIRLLSALLAMQFTANSAGAEPEWVVEARMMAESQARARHALTVGALDPIEDDQRFFYIKLLWESLDAEDKAIARPALKAIAGDSKDSHQWKVILMLLGSVKKEDNVAAYNAFRAIAEDRTHLKHERAKEYCTTPQFERLKARCEGTQ